MDLQTYFAVLLYIIAGITLISGSKVSILQAYHPKFVRLGETLEITCTSNESRQLDWYRPGQEDRITPQPGAGLTIRYTIEEPTGFVESKFIKKNVTVADGGGYICKDESRLNSFQIQVTPVEIHGFQDVTLGLDSSLSIGCRLSGFNHSNPPSIEYTWIKDGTPLNTRPDHHIIGQDDGSPGNFNLYIESPEYSDLGHYQCMFSFYTDHATLEPIHYYENIHVIGGEAFTGSSSALITRPTIILPWTLALVTLTMTRRHLWQ